MYIHLQRESLEEYKKNTPSHKEFGNIKDRVTKLGNDVPDDFDINDIHWVTPMLGITDFEGSEKSVNNGYMTINVAGELDSPAQLTFDIQPYMGILDETLEAIASIIHQSISIESKPTVIHCAYGFERSPLAVAYYMHRYYHISIDNAYGEIQKARPIVINKSHWIGT